MGRTAHVKANLQNSLKRSWEHKQFSTAAVKGKRGKGKWLWSFGVMTFTEHVPGSGTALSTHMSDLTHCNSHLTGVSGPWQKACNLPQVTYREGVGV